jgi:nucleoside-diphosphate-sugar epimerase
VLVLGAGGWFGSTFLDLLAQSAGETALLALTGRPRRLTAGRQTWDLGGWDWETIERFAPTLVVNCAFLTRERVEQIGYERYVAENTELTSRFLRTLSLPSIRAAVTVSSGAAVESLPDIPDIELNPYGHLKRKEEILPRDAAAEHGVALALCRAWSVSGLLVQRPRDYAFSDLILQATEGRIRIRAPHEVWRRYAGVDDLLAVCASLAVDGWTGEVDSGGELVEIGELTERVIAETSGNSDREARSGCVAAAGSLSLGRRVLESGPPTAGALRCLA